MKNVHCAYKITSDKGYVKLSMKKFSINIHTSAYNPSNYDCIEGGIHFRPRLLGIKYICENYTTDFLKTSTYNTWIMNIVSESREGIILIVYSFKQYSTVTVEATVTSTPCRGVVKRSKCTFLTICEMIPLSATVGR